MHQIMLAPHVPADWTSFAVRNVRVEGCTAVDFAYAKTLDTITLDINEMERGNADLEFSPALALRSSVSTAQS